MTGTPAGVGVFQKPRQLLRDGDQIEVAISGLGTLKNAVRFEEGQDSIMWEIHLFHTIEWGQWALICVMFGESNTDWDCIILSNRKLAWTMVKAKLWYRSSLWLLWTRCFVYRSLMCWCWYYGVYCIRDSVTAHWWGSTGQIASM